MAQKVKSGKQVIVSLQKMVQDFPPAETVSQGQRSASHLQNWIAFLTQSQTFSRFSVVDREFRIIADSQEEQIGKTLRDPELEEALEHGRE